MPCMGMRGLGFHFPSYLVILWINVLCSSYLFPSKPWSLLIRFLLLLLSDRSRPLNLPIPSHTRGSEVWPVYLNSTPRNLSLNSPWISKRLPRKAARNHLMAHQEDRSSRKHSIKSKWTSPLQSQTTQLLALLEEACLVSFALFIWRNVVYGRLYSTRLVFHFLLLLFVNNCLVGIPEWCWELCQSCLYIFA